MNARLDQIGENRLLNGWASWLRRSPRQLNAIHETDAELLPVPGTDKLLALTTDTVAEEIALGFYRDATTAGWVAAMASLSDLAAVGAEPAGLMVSVTMPGEGEGEFQRALATGLDRACQLAGTFVLGGDTNVGCQAAITTCAAGWVARDALLSRRGCRPGDRLYATGPLGLGSVAAAQAIFELPPDIAAGFAFRPVARLEAGRRIAGIATCAMDTSDGLIATLDQLSRLNNVGFVVEGEPSRLLEARALAVARCASVDPLVMLAAHHGEFELVFTLPDTAVWRPDRVARNLGFEPLYLGRVIDEPLLLFDGPRPRQLDGARIRNLVDETHGDLRRYLEGLIRCVG